MPMMIIRGCYPIPCSVLAMVRGMRRERSKMSIRAVICSTAKWNTAGRIRPIGGGPTYKRAYEYNQIGLESKITESELVANEWVSQSLIAISYNGAQEIVEQVTLEWNDLEETWENLSRLIYEYEDGEELLTSEVVQHWNDSLDKWVNLTNRIFQYEPNGEFLSTSTAQYWNAADQTWEINSIISWNYGVDGKLRGSEQTVVTDESELPVSSQSASYDQDGNVGEVLQSEWNEESLSWETTNRDVHFWSSYLIGNSSGTTETDHCIFQNPYLIGLPLYCDHFKDDLTYKLEVYDLMGRVHHTMTFRGKNSFRVRGDIDPGLYLFVFSGGLDVHTEKVLIKN